MTTNSNAGISPVDRKVMPHTPGPWRVGTAVSAHGVNYSILGRKSSGWINILHGNDKHTTETRAPSPEAYANARLMATAPDLLKALIEANEETKLYPGHEGRWADVIAMAMGPNAELNGARRASDLSAELGAGG